MQLKKDEAAVKFWEITIERLKEINMTNREFCRLTGLPEHSFLAMKGKKMCPNIWFYFRAKEVLGIEYDGLFETLNFSASEYYILSEDEKILIRELRKERAPKREKTIRFLMLLLKYKHNPDAVIFASDIESPSGCLDVSDDDTDVSEESDDDEEIEMTGSEDYLIGEKEIDGEKSEEDEQNSSCLSTQKLEVGCYPIHDIDDNNLVEDKSDKDDDIEVVMESGDVSDDDDEDSTETKRTVKQHEDADVLFEDEAVTAGTEERAISVSAKVEDSHDKATPRRKKDKAQDEQPSLFDNLWEEC